MITVVKEFTFDAAHYLPNYDGPCSNLHGHTYKLQVGIKGEIDESGMVMDFKKLKEMVQSYVNALDHSYLNELEGREFGAFPAKMPTAEKMVEWFVRHVSSDLAYADTSLRLDFIRLYETPTSYAEWRES